MHESQPQSSLVSSHWAGTSPSSPPSLLPLFSRPNSSHVSAIHVFLWQLWPLVLTVSALHFQACRSVTKHFFSLLILYSLPHKGLTSCFFFIWTTPKLKEMGWSPECYAFYFRSARYLPINTITISPCCESTWNSSNQTATAGLRPRLGEKKKSVREQKRRARRRDSTKRKQTEAEREKVNAEERLRTVKTGSDETDVKEAKKSWRVKLWKQRWKHNIFIMCAHSFFSSSALTAAGRDVKSKEKRQHEFVKHMTSSLHSITLKARQLLVTCGTTVTGLLMGFFWIRKLSLDSCFVASLPTASQICKQEVN